MREPRVLDLFLQLVVGLLGLTDARRDPAALIERHVHPAHDGGDLLLLQRAALSEALLILRVKRDLRQQLAHDLVTL